MERMAAILRSHGKRPAVWNEAVRTGAFARECRVHGWESVKACLDATAKGYRTVVMPGQYFYFDMRQSPREDGTTGRRSSTPKRSTASASRSSAPNRCATSRGCRGRFSAKPTSRTSRKSPTTSTTCSFRASAPSHASPGAGNAEGWDAYYEELKGKLTTGWRHGHPVPGSSRRRSATATARSPLRRTTAPRFTTLWTALRKNTLTRLRVRTGKPHLYRFYSRYGTARSPYVADKSRWRTITPAVAITTSMGESAKFPYANAESYKGLSRTRRACRAAGLDTLHVQRAGEVPRNVFADGKPPAAEDDR